MTLDLTSGLGQTLLYQNEEGLGSGWFRNHLPLCLSFCPLQKHPMSTCSAPGSWLDNGNIKNNRKWPGWVRTLGGAGAVVSSLVAANTAPQTPWMFCVT